MSRRSFSLGARWRVVAGVAVAALGFSAVTAVGTGALTQSASSATHSAAAVGARADATYRTTLDYLIRFYPRYLTYWTQGMAPKNRFVTPISGQDGLLTSKARVINAFNVDTVYATAFTVDPSGEPQILTIPETAGTFSLLTLDVWGNVFESGVPTDQPGIYALVLPGWQGELPPGVTKVTVPYQQTTWTIRSDRYSRVWQWLREHGRGREGIHLEAAYDVSV